MDIQKTRTWAEISLENIEHNFREMRGRLNPGCRFLGVVKADAYGHGALRVARLLEDCGADYLAAACFSEAEVLRRAGIGLPILIMGWSDPGLAEALADLDITQAVGDFEMARGFSEALKKCGKTLKVHIKLETGMGRLGFDAGRETGFDALRETLKLPGFQFEGIFTHFSVSDEPSETEYTRGQFRLFSETVAALEKASGLRFEIKHCANSGAMVSHPEVYLDMVRPGLALYGMYPGAEKGAIALRPAMQLKTRIAMITEHRAGDSISYGRTFRAGRDMRAAVLPIGYADGLHRVLSNRIEVLINGRRCRQIGRICMDMCMADVTDLPGVRAGDVATVFGRDGDAVLPVEEQAEKAGTISYELVCAVSGRVPRVYVD